MSSDNLKSGGKTGFVYHPDYEKHVPFAGHPECPDRVIVIKKAYEQLANINTELFAPRIADKSELKIVHTETHISQMRKMCKEMIYHGGMESILNPQTWQSALRAAGGGIEACNKVLLDEWKNAFCAVRPPGHHAWIDASLGFCMFNNIAIAAAFLLESGVGKILIADWDVHHGNGTQQAFYESDRVFFYSMHQADFYPPFSGLKDQIGRGKGTNYTLNHPIPAGTTGDAQFEMFKNDIDQITDKFTPDFVLISCGFDSCAGDHLGSLNLESNHYAEMTAIVSNFTEGRIVSFLEGGYNLKILGNLFEAHFSELIKAI